MLVKLLHIEYKEVNVLIRETGIAIKDILKMKSFEKSNIIAGEGGINRIITRVNVMADPDILNWVDKGEFLLTTGYFFKTTKLENQLNLIRESNFKKLSGMGIKIFPYLDKMPEEIIKLANELNFPIIEIDYEVPFTDIMTPVFQEIFNRQSSIINKVQIVHKDTMNVLLKGGSIKDIIGNLSKTLENPIVVVDHHFDEIIIDSLGDSQIYKKLEDDINLTFSKNKLRVDKNKTSRDKINIDEDDIDRIMVPIMVKNNIYGHLIAYGMKSDLSDFDVLYMESTSTVVAVEFLKRISIQEVENKYKAEFFEDLISFDEFRKKKAIERANYYKLDKDASYSVLTLRLSKTESSIDSDEEYNQMLVKVMYMIDLICKNECNSYLTANKGKKINILFMWKKSEDSNKKINLIAQMIKESLNAKVASIKFKMGIGRETMGLANVYKSLKDAEKAVDATKNYVDGDIINFETLGIYKIFCQDNLKEELISFYKSTLEPLVEYDRKRDTELVKSLRIYFETNGNLKKMSEKLFTHYNTVLYRINRIQEITKRNLNDEMDRYGLETSMKIMRILNL
ncbi:PucR family transcriptional regulator [Helicovermis profundi]|uniref:PucR family transcriptional regulator n=1 Tax=Helicovermis profundi TaxID=3065157 RepID=UPI0030D1C161